MRASDGGDGRDGSPDAPLDGSTDGATDAAPEPDASELDASDPDASGSDAAIDAGPNPPVCDDLPLLATIGTRAAPYEASARGVELITDMPLDWTGRAFVRITDLEQGESYTLRANSASGVLELAVFDDDETFEQASCVEQTVPLTGAVCSVVASSTSMYVSVDAAASTRIDLEIREGMVSFDPEGEPDAGLPLEPVPHVSEGTKAKPVSRPLSAGEVEGQVSSDGISYYALTGLEDGQRYRIDSESSYGELRIDVFSEPGFSDGECMFDELLETACAVEATGSTLYISVADRGNPNGASFKLQIQSFEDFAAADAVKDMTAPCTDGTAFEGHVGAAGFGYVAIHGLDNRYAYVVDVAGHDWFDIDVFSGAGAEPFTGDGCAVYSSQAFSERCIQRPADAALYVRVGSMPAGTRFSGTVRTLERAHALGSHEAPVELSVEAAAFYEARIPADGAALFLLTGLEPDTAYSLRIASIDEVLVGDLSKSDRFDDLTDFDPDETGGEPNLTVSPGTPLVHAFTTDPTTTTMYLHLIARAPAGSDFTLRLSEN